MPDVSGGTPLSPLQNVLCFYSIVTFSSFEKILEDAHCTQDQKYSIKKTFPFTANIQGENLVM